MTAIQSDEQRTVLHRYATGQPFDVIAKDLRLQQDAVAGMVSRLAGMNRGRARQLVEDYDRSRLPKAEVKVEPRLEKSDAALLLMRAEQSDDARLARLAVKVRELLDEISTGLEAAEASKVVRERIAKLEAELAAARAELNKARPPRKPAGGRKRRLADDVREEVVRRFNAGEKPTHIARDLNAGTAMVYRILHGAGVELRGHTG